MFKLITFLNFVFNTYAYDCKRLQNEDHYSALMALSTQCQNKDVHLTFDDGPIEGKTNLILDELLKRKIKATFFISTEKLQVKSHSEKVEESTRRRIELIQRQLKEGHLVASHGHDHIAHDFRMTAKDQSPERLDQQSSLDQIQTSENFLNQATQGKFKSQPFKLFRFPFGRGATPSALELNLIAQKMKHSECRSVDFTQKDTNPNIEAMYSACLKLYRQGDNNPSLINIFQRDFSHLGWDIDSQDSQSWFQDQKTKNVERISKVLENICRNPKKGQVALFHDIHLTTADMIGETIDIGQCLGIRFVSFGDLISKHQNELSQNGTFLNPLLQAVRNSLVKSPKVGNIHLVCPQFDNSKKLKKVECILPANPKMGRSQSVELSRCQGESSICYKGEMLTASYLKDEMALIVAVKDPERLKLYQDAKKECFDRD